MNELMKIVVHSRGGENNSVSLCKFVSSHVTSILFNPLSVVVAMNKYDYYINLFQTIILFQEMIAI